MLQPCHFRADHAVRNALTAYVRCHNHSPVSPLDAAGVASGQLPAKAHLTYSAYSPDALGWRAAAQTPSRSDPSRHASAATIKRCPPPVSAGFQSHSASSQRCERRTRVETVSPWVPGTRRLSHGGRIPAVPARTPYSADRGLHPESTWRPERIALTKSNTPCVQACVCSASGAISKSRPAVHNSRATCERGSQVTILRIQFRIRARYHPLSKAVDIRAARCRSQSLQIHIFPWNAGSLIPITPFPATLLDANHHRAGIWSMNHSTNGRSNISSSNIVLLLPCSICVHSAHWLEQNTVIVQHKPNRGPGSHRAVCG